MRALARLAGTLNRLPVGERALRVGADRVYVASLDRWLAALGWRLGWLEGAERRLMARIVGSGMVAVDVGANVGVHTLHLARRVGPGGRVHALEPAPENFRLLARAIDEAGLPQVRLHQVAAGERAGQGTLHLSAANRGDHRSHAAADLRAAVAVRVVALDELLADEARVDFVKIDVQGDEVSVLRGLGETLRRSPGVAVLCEVCPLLLRAAGASPEEVFALLGAAGLRPHRLGRDGTPEALEAGAGCAAAEAAGYLNLLFRAP